ncbi:MAG: phosphoribosylanthranilate isomerase [Chthoniobacterales bacterium]
MQKIIKICGITTPESALETSMEGAHFIGLVFHPESPRFLSLAQAREITSALLNTTAHPVAVFTEHSAHEMQYLCEEFQIEIVQLHGERSRKEHIFLPSHIQRIYVLPVSEYRHSKHENAIALCDPVRDYLLIDHPHPGKGNSFDWNTFRYDHSFPWLLAGGLTPDNVGKALQQLQPDGVDVASGVESAPGIKESMLIKKFIQQVKQHKT